MITTTKNETVLEKRKVKENASFLAIDYEGVAIPYERYSSFTKLIRVIAYCLRFAVNAKVKKSDRVTTSLTTVEHRTATSKLIIHCKHKMFKDDIYRIFTKGNVSKKIKLRQLNPFIDDVGLLRVGG